MRSVGELLRDERLRQGLELAEVAERTRINLSYLQAIESGDTESLPGAFFYRSFVRQYAHVLGMDEEALEPTLSELREQAEATQALPSPVPAAAPIEVPPIPTPAASRRFSGPKPASLILLVAVIVGCSGIYALWQRSRRVEPVPPQTPVSVAAQSPSAVTQPVTPPPQQQTPPAAESGPVQQPQPVAQPGAARVAEPAVTPPAETPKPAAPAAEQPVPANARFNIELAASEMVWLSATTDGKKTTIVLQPGQSRRLAADQSASVFLGNAGGIDIRVNGKSLGPIGPRGQLRIVAISAEGVTIANPREKKEPPPAPPAQPQ